jgi:hypothetical protein
MRDRTFTSLTFLCVCSLCFYSIQINAIYGQLQSNFTSRVCDPHGNCTITVCMNNEPCRTVKSNSTSGIDQDNSTAGQNKTEPLEELHPQIL